MSYESTVGMMRTNPLRSGGFVAFLLLALVWAAAAPAAQGPRFYSPDGLHALEIDPSRVVVHSDGPPGILGVAGASLQLLEEQSALLPRGGAAYRLEAPSPEGAVETARELAGLPGIAWASPVYLHEGAEMIVGGRVAARFPEGSDPGALASSVGLRLLEEHAPGIWLLGGETGSGPDLVEATARLVEEGLAVWAAPDFLTTIVPRYIPNDGRFPTQWHLDNWRQGGGRDDVDVNAPEGWELMPADAVLGHRDIIIAIVDGATEWGHADLVENVWTNEGEIPGNGIDDDGNGYRDDIHGWDYVDNDPDMTVADRCDDHGTSVSGVAAARGDNGIGVIGACGRCRIMLIRLISGGPVSDVEKARAFRYAGDNGAAILNNSWGSNIENVPLPFIVREAIDYAIDEGRGGRGSTFFFSAGNEHPQSVDGDGYAAYERVIAVGAVNDQGVRSQYSETGDSLDLVAPSNDEGRDGISTTQTGYLVAGPPIRCVEAAYDDWFGGTSSASPLAAGVGGLVLSAVPAIRPEKLQRILEDNAERRAPDILFPSYEPVEHGRGLVRADTAVDDVMSGPTFDRLSYECNDQSIVLSVRDATASGSLVALITSDADSENVTCNEVPGRAGLFEATVPTTFEAVPTPDDGVLVVSPNDTLTANYGGFQDTAGGTCDDSRCFSPPIFAGLKRVDDGAECAGTFPVLHWDPPSSWGAGAAWFYIVYRADNPGFDPDTSFPHFRVDPTELSWTDIGAVVGNTYWYAVRAESDELGCGGPTGGHMDDNQVKLSGTILAGNEAPPIRDLKPYHQGNDGVTRFTWTVDADDIRFDLYRGNLVDGPFAFAPVCFRPDLADPADAEDSETPALPTTGFYYLATREHALCGTSEFGPADVPRGAPPACP